MLYKNLIHPPISVKLIQLWDVKWIESSSTASWEARNKNEKKRNVSRCWEKSEYMRNDRDVSDTIRDEC